MLDSSHERVFSTSAGVEQVELGLYIIRGDNMYACISLLKYSQLIRLSAVIGELDLEKDAKSDMESIRAAPLRPLQH